MRPRPPRARWWAARGLTVLLLYLMNLAQPNWWLLGGFVTLTAALVIWELRAEQPFLDLRMLAVNKALVATYAGYGLTPLIIYGMLYGFSQWLQQARGLSPRAARVLLLPMSLVAGIATVTGARKRRVRRPLLIGTVALLLASIGLLTLTAGIAVLVVIGVSVLFGLPNGSTWSATRPLCTPKPRRTTPAPPLACSAPLKMSTRSSLPASSDWSTATAPTTPFCTSSRSCSRAQRHAARRHGGRPLAEPAAPRSSSPSATDLELRPPLSTARLGGYPRVLG